MWNKIHTRSNAETEDGEDEDKELMDPSFPHQQTPIVDVWHHNFDQQLAIITALASQYPVIALDTEFPGNCVSRQLLANHYSHQELEYQLIWHNVEQTKLIQVGLALADHEGRSPPIPAWQFHLRFDITRDTSVTDSIDLLKTAGVDFERLKADGIDSRRFSEGLLSSGLILNRSIQWVVFQGSYDFGYLLRLLRAESLPRSPEDFYKAVRIYFPHICDLKHLIFDDQQLRSMGLSSLAQSLGCLRTGPNHQAGSDSLLTLRVYFQLQQLLGQLHCQQRSNVIHGISAQPPSYSMHNYHSYVIPYSFGPLYQYLNQSYPEYRS